MTLRGSLPGGRSHEGAMLTRHTRARHLVAALLAGALAAGGSGCAGLTRTSDVGPAALQPRCVASSNPAATSPAPARGGDILPAYADVPGGTSVALMLGLPIVGLVAALGGSR